MKLIDGKPHHYLADDGSIVIAKESLSPEEVLAEVSSYSEPEYLSKRVEAYPPIGEQLDMIYHDIDEWRKRIDDIKKRYKKT